jgi:hypothetical protein
MFIIPEKALEMKATYARRIFHECLSDIKEASFNMKERRARRILMRCCRSCVRSQQ